MALLSRSGREEDHESFRESARRFFESEVAPHLDDWRSAGRIPAELFRAAGAQGFLGTAIPEEFEGGGVDDPRFTAVLVEEAVAVGAVGLALLLAHHCGVCVPAVLRLPDSELRSQWLTGLATGELLAVPAVLRPSLDALGVAGAASGGLFVVSVPEPDAEPRVMVLDRDALTVDRLDAALAGREAATADVQVPGDALSAATAIPDHDPILRRDLDLWNAVLAMAGARSALEMTLAYVTERHVFGRSVASFENTRFRLAEVGSDIAVAQSFTDSCLAALADGSLHGATAAAARFTSERVHARAVDQGMQLHGGYGYMREYPISHAFADARFLRVSAAAASDPRETLALALGL